jgi:hypothetical protein
MVHESIGPVEGEVSQNLDSIHQRRAPKFPVVTESDCTVSEVAVRPER